MVLLHSCFASRSLIVSSCLTYSGSETVQNGVEALASLLAKIFLFTWKTACTKVTEAFQQQTWEDNVLISSVYLWFMFGKHPSFQWRTKISFGGKHRFSGWWHTAGKLPFFPQRCMNFEKHRILWSSIFLNWLSDVVLCYTNCFRWYGKSAEIYMDCIYYSKNINLTFWLENLESSYNI